MNSTLIPTNHYGKPINVELRMINATTKQFENEVKYRAE